MLCSSPDALLFSWCSALMALDVLLFSRWLLTLCSALMLLIAPDALLMSCSSPDALLFSWWLLMLCSALMLCWCPALLLMLFSALMPCWCSSLISYRHKKGRYCLEYRPLKLSLCHELKCSTFQMLWCFHRFAGGAFCFWLFSRTFWFLRILKLGERIEWKIF